MLLTKVNQLLASGGVGSLLKVRVKAREEGVSAGRNAVALVGRLGPVRGVVLGVELR